MGYRFHTPTVWPEPPSPDWVPPEGWRPDPSWPPAPEGWDFWVEDPTFAGPPAPAPQASVPPQTGRKENWIRQRLHQLLADQLEPGEELRWFSVVYHYKAPRFIVGLFSWSILLPIFGPLIAMMLRRPWYVGVTSTRVMFVPEKSGKTPVPAISVPLAAVTPVRKGRHTGGLLVAAPPEGLPGVFTLIRGDNINELEALLGSVRTAAG